MDNKTYLFSYPYDGKRYSLHIIAGSENEAKERVKNICFARYDGQLDSEIVITYPNHFFKRLIVKLLYKLAT